MNRNKGNIETAVAGQMQAEVSLNVTEREIQRKVIEAALDLPNEIARDGEMAARLCAAFRGSRRSG